jgi:hypothetical protein
MRTLDGASDVAMQGANYGVKIFWKAKVSGVFKKSWDGFYEDLRIHY